MSDDLCKLSAVDLVAAYADGSVSPVEVTQAALKRINSHNQVYNAFCLIDDEGALVSAKQSEKRWRQGASQGRIDGVPATVKDLVLAKDWPTQRGSRTSDRSQLSPEDAPAVARLREHGAVILGKTTTPEYGWKGVTDSPLTGITRNPWNLDHTPGGSSSGSGAAVAAGMVPVALGTQTAASVNRPAAYCGIAAFKPSTRLIPGGGVEPLSYLFDTVGFYGSRVADAAAVFEAICPFHARRGAPAPETLNVAMLSDPLIDGSDDEIMRSLAAVGEKIADAGHSVTQRASPVSFAGLLETHMQTMIYEISRIRRAFLDQPEGAIGPMLLDAIREGLAISDDAYLKLRRTLDKWRDEFFANFADIDAIV